MTPDGNNVCQVNDVLLILMLNPRVDILHAMLIIMLQKCCRNVHKRVTKGVIKSVKSVTFTRPNGQK